MEWPATLNELVKRMNKPRVVVDNTACPSATLVKVDSASCRNCILLTAVQVLTDLNLTIKKAYISADGPWFMDVFHVVDQRGLKLADPKLLALIEHSICNSATTADDDEPSGQFHSTDDALAGMTALELTGTDRPGLLSEVFAVLRDLECSVVEAKVWTHNGRIASLIFVKDIDSGCPIKDAGRIGCIEARLRNVLSGDHDVRGAKTAVAALPLMTHSDRRLHQLMFADRDYERIASAVGTSSSSSSKTSVSVQNLAERGYSIVSVQCRDRPKLMFDTVCTLTDMEYVVFHGTVDTFGDLAYQEFYVRHLDGTPTRSEAERQRVIQCLQAAIDRRTYNGWRLELRATDRIGLLAEVTRTFRENGLSVIRAEVTTKAGMAMNEFYVTDTGGHLPDGRLISAVIERVGGESLKLNKEPLSPPYCHKRSASATAAANGGRGGGGGGGLLSLGSLVMRNLHNLGLIRS